MKGNDGSFSEAEVAANNVAGITFLDENAAKKFELIGTEFGDGQFESECEIFKATNGADTGKEVKYDEDWLNMQPKQGVLVEIYEPGASEEQDKLIAATVVYSGSELTVDQIKALALAGDIEAGKQVEKVFKDRECSAQEVTVKETISGDIKFYVTYETKEAITELMAATDVTAKSSKDSKKDGYEFQSYDGTLFKLEPSADRYIKYDAYAGDWMKDQTVTTPKGTLSLNSWMMPTGSKKAIMLTNKSAKEIEITLYYIATDSKMELLCEAEGQTAKTITTYKAYEGKNVLVLKDGDATTGYLNGITGQEGTKINTTASEKPIYQVTFKIPGSTKVSLNVNDQRLCLFGIYATDTPAS